MDNGDVLPFDVVHHHFPDLCLRAPVPQKEQIPPLERGLHAARQHHDDGRRRVRHHREPLPEHECRRQHEGEVEHLREQLAWRQVRQRGYHNWGFFCPGGGSVGFWVGIIGGSEEKVFFGAEAWEGAVAEGKEKGLVYWRKDCCGWKCDCGCGRKLRCEKGTLAS